MKNDGKSIMRRVLSDGLVKLFLLSVVIMSVFPFIYMFIISMMEDTSSMKISLDRIMKATWSFENYKSLFISSGGFLRYILNSTVVSIYACLLTCLISAMAAYAFAKKRFCGSNQIYYIFVMTMMIPAEALLIPSFLIVKKVGLMDTYSSLVLPVFNAYGVILIRSFMKKLPNELLEAADIDGCGEVTKFVSVVLPLIKPVLISLAIFTFITTWGRLLWPLVIASGKMTTVTQAVANMKNTLTVPNYGQIMAATTTAFLPPFILYLFLQKQFVDGIALSGIKG